jgi:N-acetyl-anhydromuramyl-L-alanine amidase AmpD
MEKYNIPLANVSGHGYTKGEQTKCPGKHFPMERFLKDIER